MRLFFTSLALALGFSTLQAQVAKDITVPLTATIATSPASITLNWPNPGNANILILRRTKGQAGNSWQQVINIVGSNLTSLTDNGVAVGQIYEYVIQRTVNNFNAFGYAHVAINANPVNSRGKILILVDSTTADAAGVELVRLKNDMRGDGWWPIPFKTGPSSTVQSVKNQILTAYNADPLNVKAVLLIGNVPIPYSGNTNWDGHAEHAGAWPSDAYYGDVNGVWTDNTVNNTTPARAANVNIPGDGKFDQSILPSLVELQVGRIDFRRLDANAFGAPDHVALLKRYLEKNHRWRTGQYIVDNKALVDDNFGYFGGEAFAANGFRNAYPLVGEANIIEADFFNDTDSQSFLMGYGCGGGTYQSAGGVGTSANFAVDSVNIVFSNLFGSYHGDWDFETNPFMPAALASRGGILNCSWAGRPHHFYQALASGETIGYVMWETMNAQFNNGFYGSLGESGAHVALLGDPTIRANVVKPATNFTAAVNGCNSILLNWTASADVVSGYHIYRAFSQDGPYTRLTINPIVGTTFTDNNPILDTLYYQVRAIKNVTNPGGGTYANNAVGPIEQIVFDGSGGPEVTATGGALTCAAFNVVLGADASPSSIASWNWVGPNNFSSSLQNPTVNVAGTYTVTATDATGCQGTATATVVIDAAAPTIEATVSNDIDCIHQDATITIVTPGLSSGTISGPGGFFAQGNSAVVTMPGSYTITAVSDANGCMGSTAVMVLANTAVPSIQADNSGPLTCAEPSVDLIAMTSAQSPSVMWTGPCLTGMTTANCAGTYIVVVTDMANGCTAESFTMVAEDVEIPQVSAQGGTLTCDVTEVPLIASSNIPNANFAWTGPCVSPQFEATCGGTYTVVVTNAANGCTNSASVEVLEDTQAPIFNLPAIPPLTCDALCALIAVPVMPGIEFFFDGQLIPQGTDLEICQPGTYQLIVKSTSNGCSSEVEFIIEQDASIPVANAGPNMVLSCLNASVQLDGSTNTAGATYLWTGPNGFSSNIPNPTVDVAGTYILVVTDPTNGCTGSDQVSVTSDPSVPTANASASGPLNCDNTSVSLSSGNVLPNAMYQWTGPNNFSSNLPNPTVSEPGIYTVVVTLGACTASDMTEVFKAPDLMVNFSPTSANCDGAATECLQVSGGTMPYNILWSNGSTTACATYPGGGVIGVSVTDAGGCSFENTNTVVVPPALTATTAANLDCSGSTTICIMASGGTAPYAFAWSNGNTSGCTTLSSGAISATVTDAAGCIFVIPTIVIVETPPIAISSVVTNESAPNANNGAVNISVTGGSGMFVYTWSTGATTQDISNLPGGTYTVTVTDVSSGCTKTATAVVNTASSVDEATVFSHFNLSPNPTEGWAMLSIQLHEASEMQLEIRDMAGRLIWEKSVPESLTVDIPFDLGAVPAGIYAVSVQLGERIFVRKLAVQR